MLCDGLATLGDFKGEFVSNLLSGMTRDALDGVNGTLFLIGSQGHEQQTTPTVADIIQGTSQGQEGLFSRLAAELLAGQDRVVTVSIYEVYGDVVRDLITPSSTLALHEEFGGLRVTGLLRQTVSSVVEIAHIMNRVQENQFQSHNDDAKCWVIYQLDLEQHFSVEGVSLYSTCRLVSTCALEFASLDRTRLVLSHGLVLAESMTAVFDAIREPSMVFSAAATLLSLLEAEIGGNCGVRWLGVVNEHDLETEGAIWLLNLLNRVRLVTNTPVSNSKNFLENRKRDWKHFKTRMAVRSSDIDRTQQKEQDLLNRINSLIQASSGMQAQVQASSKNVLEAKKRVVEGQIELAKLQDELDKANEIIMDLQERERQTKRIAAEKMGSNRKILAYQDKLSFRIQELEWHVNHLLNANAHWKEKNEATAAELELLNKHNKYLQERFTGAKRFEEKQSLWTHGGLPKMSFQEKEEDVSVLFDKYHQLHKEFRIKTREQIERCSRIVSVADASEAAMDLNGDLLKSYIDHENDLVRRIKELERGKLQPGANTGPDHEWLQKELSSFVQETQLRLEKERYALLAKCTALQEELDA
ncbi:hypothetical protein HDV03_004678 [Kappamyces sp. JEL0829]|nr:hypothetical protein HDV03_004678 [Kappamyces sp. JEL0829]